jgi:hypothetical protein
MTNGFKRQRTSRSASKMNNQPLSLPLHISDISLHIRRETRTGTVYSEEIVFLKNLETAGESNPIVQLTPELLEANEIYDDDSSDDEENDEQQDSTASNEGEDNSSVDGSLVSNGEGKMINKKEATATAFYYKGNCKNDLKSHDKIKRNVICRCPHWHLISSPHMYSLVDNQYTLFEVLKGNQEGDEAGFVTEGYFYNVFGKLLCETNYDVKGDEYHIKPKEELLWD